jgi:hypothetical protein
VCFLHCSSFCFALFLYGFSSARRMICLRFLLKLLFGKTSVLIDAAQPALIFLLRSPPQLSLPPAEFLEFSHLHPKCAAPLKLCEFLQVIAGIIFESPDQKTRGFVI